MRSYLVVANQTLCSEELLGALRRCRMSEACHFHLLVPASHPHSTLTWTAGADAAAARRRLDHALRRVGDLGAVVTGEIGDAQPLQAIDDVLRRQRFDGIVLSTLPAGVSRWLRQDLPRRVERAFRLPLTHVATRAPDPDQIGA
ncbi:MAG: hypothetical protein JO265_05220 [Acidimicrobiia bacterium]|nr:hypothetical protein [Acidimicrobiia bacterium]